MNISFQLIIGSIFIKMKCRCLRTGPGDLIINTKHLKFECEYFLIQQYYTYVWLLKTVLSN